MRNQHTLRRDGRRLTLESVAQRESRARAEMRRVAIWGPIMHHESDTDGLTTKCAFAGRDRSAYLQALRGSCATGVDGAARGAAAGADRPDR